MTDPASISDAEVFAAYPAVLIDRDNVEHYRGLVAGRLLINRCQACGQWIYPHRPMCPKCLSWDVKPTEVSGEGRVFMFTMVMQERDPNSRQNAPTCAAAIELAEQPGLRYLAPVVGCDFDKIREDMPVRLTWIEQEGRKTPAFKPASPSSSTKAEA